MPQTNESRVFSVYDLPPVSSGDGQQKRDVAKLKNANIVHMIMDKDPVIPSHSHTVTSETIAILKGNGAVYRGKEVFEVTSGGFIDIKEKNPHKIQNIGEGELEYLVISAIPFYSHEDYHLINTESEPEKIGKLRKNEDYTYDADGSLVWTVHSSWIGWKYNLGIFYKLFRPKKQAVIHYHVYSHEWNYVLSGKGIVILDDKIYPLEKGSVVCIPTHTNHGLENTQDEPLNVICISSPPYYNRDFHRKKDTHLSA